MCVDNTILINSYPDLIKINWTSQKLGGSIMAELQRELTQNKPPQQGFGPTYSRHKILLLGPLLAQ